MKDTDWLNGYKNKTHIYMLSTRNPLRPIDTYRLKVRGWKNTFHANRKQKKVGVAILISDKIDLKEYCKRQGRTLHNDQGINPRGRRNNCKYLCTQHRRTSIHKTNTNRHKKKLTVTQ